MNMSASVDHAPARRFSSDHATKSLAPSKRALVLPKSEFWKRENSSFMSRICRVELANGNPLIILGNFFTAYARWKKPIFDRLLSILFFIFKMGGEVDVT